MGMSAWAHAMTPTDVTSCLARFPGLGAVLYPQNYDAALSGPGPWIAYVGNESQAEAVANLANIGVKWDAAIILDERNNRDRDAPSAAYLAPSEYAARYRSITPPLTDAGVPVSTMGLAAVSTWWEALLWRRRFDDAYHRELPPADLRAFNPNKVRRAEIGRVLSGYSPTQWILSPAPFRGFWDRLREPMSVPDWVALSRDPRVHTLALWCLRDYGDPHFGLLDARGEPTNVGRALLQALP